MWRWKKSPLRSPVVVEALQSMWERHGIPVEVVTDGGPPFNSRDFSTFAARWGFKHTRTSPHLPRSNGQAERTVQTAKNLLRKALEDGSNISQVLLTMKTTPLPGSEWTPAQLLMGRRLNTTLPTGGPSGRQVDHVKHRQHLLTSQSHWARRGAHPMTLPSLAEGQQVYNRAVGRKWHRAQ